MASLIKIDLLYGIRLPQEITCLNLNLTLLQNSKIKLYLCIVWVLIECYIFMLLSVTVNNNTTYNDVNNNGDYAIIDGHGSIETMVTTKIKYIG